MAGGGWAAFGPIWCPPSGLQPARRHPDYPRPTCDPSGAHEHPCGAHTSPVAPGCRSAPAAGGRRPSTPARSQSRRSGSPCAAPHPAPSRRRAKPSPPMVVRTTGVHPVRRPGRSTHPGQAGPLNQLATGLGHHEQGGGQVPVRPETARDGGQGSL